MRPRASTRINSSKRSGFVVPGVQSGLPSSIRLFLQDGDELALMCDPTPVIPRSRHGPVRSLIGPISRTPQFEDVDLMVSEATLEGLFPELLDIVFARNDCFRRRQQFCVGCIKRRKTRGILPIERIIPLFVSHLDFASGILGRSGLYKEHNCQDCADDDSTKHANPLFEKIERVTYNR